MTNLSSEQKRDFVQSEMVKMWKFVRDLSNGYVSSPVIPASVHDFTNMFMQRLIELSKTL